MDCSLPGYSVHGVFQARVLEWGAIAFSGSGVLEHSKMVLVSASVFAVGPLTAMVVAIISISRGSPSGLLPL